MEIKQKRGENFYRELDQTLFEKLKKFAPASEDNLLDKIGKRFQYHLLWQRYSNQYYNPADIRNIIVTGVMAISSVGLLALNLKINDPSFLHKIAVGICAGAALLTTACCLAAVGNAIDRYPGYDSHYEINIKHDS